MTRGEPHPRDRAGGYLRWRNGITRLPRTTRSRYRLFVAAQGWTRRLDDRFELLLERRFGPGLTKWADWSLRRQLATSLAGSGAVGLVLVVALVASGQAGRIHIFLWPVVGTVVGTALGRLIQDARKRRQVLTKITTAGAGPRSGSRWRTKTGSQCSRPVTESVTDADAARGGRNSPQARP